MSSSEFLPFWWGGLLMASVALAYRSVTGSMLGMSGLYDRLLRRVRFGPSRVSTNGFHDALLAETLAQFGALPPVTQAPASPADPAKICSEDDRLWFIPGVVLGALLVTVLQGHGADAMSLGQSFTARFGSGAPAFLVLFASGLLLGFGARMGGGCTSGHGISGVALGQRGSLLGTAVFWCTAVATTWVFVLAEGAR